MSGLSRAGDTDRRTTSRARRRGLATAITLVAVTATLSAQGPAPATAPALKFAVTIGPSPTGQQLGQVIGQPIVIDLDRDGSPEIVFMAMGTSAYRRLIAVHGSDGSIAFARDVFLTSSAPPVVLGDPNGELAAGDINGDGYPEIIAVDAHDGTASDPFRRQLLAFNYLGNILWQSDDVVSDPIVDSTSGFSTPAIADLDGDGLAEIVVGYAAKGPLTPANVVSEDYVTVFDNAGHIRWTARGGGTTQGLNPTSNAPVVVDLDLDGSPEILFSDDVFDHLGTLERSVNDVNLRVAGVGVANFDDDPYPEMLYNDVFGNLWLYEHNGTRIWGPVTPAGTGNYLPAIGDTDGDGVPEIVVARDTSIAILSRTGAAAGTIALPQTGFGGSVTIFDLDADGAAEIIYHSARGPFDTASAKGALYVFDGRTRTGHAIFASRNGNDQNRGPLVADVNGDGSAEIVTPGWGESTLLRVFRANAGTWAQTRPIWNQYAFHATHVRSNGTIPARPPINWLTPGLNNFRANGTPEVAQGPPPVAAADAYSTASGAALTIAAPGVLANDTANGAFVRAALVVAPLHGTVTLSGSGSFQYTPASGYTGSDTWSYRAATSNGVSAAVAVTMQVVSTTTPVPPTAFQVVSRSGNSVTLGWTAPSSGAAPTGYLLEGGLAPGQVLGSVPLGPAPGTTLVLPTGVLYLRVRTVTASGQSAPSNELQVFVNVAAPPAAPGNLLGLAVGSGVTLAWQNASSGGAPTAILLDVSGPVSGTVPLGPTESFSFNAMPPGSYTFAVRAANAAGTSSASNAVTLTFPTACSGAPLAPAHFTATKSGVTVSLGWDLPATGPAPSGYVLIVSGAFTGSVPLQGRSISAPVPAGTYTFSVAAANACGTSVATPATTITVP